MLQLLQPSRIKLDWLHRVASNLVIGFCLLSYFPLSTFSISIFLSYFFLVLEKIKIYQEIYVDWIFVSWWIFNRNDGRLSVWWFRVVFWWVSRGEQILWQYQLNLIHNITRLTIICTWNAFSLNIFGIFKMRCMSHMVSISWHNYGVVQTSFLLSYFPFFCQVKLFVFRTSQKSIYAVATNLCLLLCNNWFQFSTNLNWTFIKATYNCKSSVHRSYVMDSVDFESTGSDFSVVFKITNLSISIIAVCS